MTEKEMSEIFSVMLLAYPNAECFKGGKEKLLPTIKLWQRCCIDVDFWTAQRAVYKLITECKFPPTIAEFLEKATAATKEIENSAMECYLNIREAVRMFGEEEAYQYIGTKGRQVIDAMGGMDKIFDPSGKMFLMDKIVHTYIAMERGLPAMPGGKNQKQIGDGK